MPPSLIESITRLVAFYGEPEPPPTRDPFELVLWENVAYLTDDRRRRAAFEALRARVGLTPQAILAASPQQLSAIAGAGILPELQATKLHAAAQIALSEFGGDLRATARLPLAQAKRAFQRFPALGEPGAEKVLLFSGNHPVLALEFNGLRALLRLGFGQEQKNYSASYRSVQAAVAPELPADCDWLIRAHQLLRQHGQTLCRRSQPRCGACPLAEGCAYWTAQAGGGEAH